MNKVAILWTGGKDSALAYWRVRDAGFNIVALVTFVPIGNTEFKAHPQSEIKKQARYLGVPIYFCEVIEPFYKSYVAQLSKLKKELGISAVVTGDIDFVAGEPSWIAACSKETQLEVLRPLWQESRSSLMADLLRNRLRARITWINHPAIPRDWVGRMINEDFVRDMNDLCARTGMDLCGENGEYHTMVEF